MQHDAVSECAVIGESDDDRGMIVKGFIVLKSGVKANDEERSSILTPYPNRLLGNYSVKS